MINIICVGKIKEAFYREAIEEYLKRLSKYVKVSIIEIEDISNGEKEKILNNEACKIISYLTPKDYIVTLEIDGQSITSEQFADFIEKKQSTYGNITFIIGSSYGLSEEIKKLSKDRLSFSKLTFPHQLFRVIFLEQLYRAYKINNNEAYHK